MSRPQGFKRKQLALATALLGATLGSAQASNSRVYFFGDSLSDNGAYAPMLPITTNARFTTNPGNSVDRQPRRRLRQIGNNHLRGTGQREWSVCADHQRQQLCRRRRTRQ